MEIWIGRDGERHGPYKEEDVRQWLRSGQVSPTDLAWHEGLADWQPLSVLLPDAVSAPPAASSTAAAPPALDLPQTTTAALEDHAGFWKRVAAYIVDAIVLIIPQMLVENAFGGQAAKAILKQATIDAAGNPDAMMAANIQYYATMWPATLVILGIVITYFATCESSRWQGTLGKLALGIRVTDLDGNRISFARALGRYLAKFLSVLTLGIGFLMVAWTRRKQALHDMVCSTLVLNGRASEFNSAPTKASNDSSFSA